MPGTDLRLDEAGDRLLNGNRSFDPWTLGWREVADATGAGRPAGAAEAVRWLGRNGRMRRVPVGVIGPRDATPEQYARAESVGRRLAGLGLQLVCGGRNGVMEAACKGHLEAGGQPIGLLPDEEWETANPFVAIPLATGIGVARNAIIARACVALIAVGGGYGTMSEMVLGLHFNRLVIALDAAPEVPGALRFDDLDEALDRVCRRVLKLD